MKKLNKDQYKMFEKIWDKKVPANSEIYMGEGKKPLDADSVRLKTLADNVIAWGERSHQGLCCGIFHCEQDPKITCAICKGAYCKEHRKMHNHFDDTQGVHVQEVPSE